MTEERRYGKDEVSEIVEAAAAARPSSGSAHLPSVRGLTLAELQEIGVEVGVAPDRIADAAAKVDRRRNATPARTWLGMPVSAGRAAAVEAAGIAGLLLAVPLFAVTLITGGVGENLVGSVMMGSAGASALAYNALRLPPWARERERQMEYIAGRASALIAADPEK
jgi:hypothetical protein